MIFYRIVGSKKITKKNIIPSGDHLSYICPFISVDLVRLQKYKIFRFIPWTLSDHWIQMIVPPKPALFYNNILLCLPLSTLFSVPSGVFHSFLKNIGD